MTNLRLVEIIGTSNEDCAAKALLKIADRIKTQMEDQHKVAVKLNIRETPEYLTDDLIEEIQGCSRLTAAKKVIEKGYLSALSINVLWDDLQLDHVTPKMTMYWDPKNSTYIEFMRLSHHSNYQLLPGKVNDIKSDALTIDMKGGFDKDEKFVGFVPVANNSIHMRRAYNAVCDELRKIFLSWQETGIEELAVAHAKRLFANRYHRDAPENSHNNLNNSVDIGNDNSDNTNNSDDIVFDNSVIMDDDNNESVQQIDNSLVMEDNDVPGGPDNEFNPSAIARAQEMHAVCHPMPHRTHHRTRRPSQVTVRRVEIDGHNWRDTTLSGFKVSPVVNLEFSKEGILYNESLQIGSNEVSRTSINTHDVIFGAETNMMSAGYRAWDDLLRKYVDTYIRYYKPRKTAERQNPNGNMLTTTGLCFMIWYIIRKHYSGNVTRIVKAIRKTINGTLVIVYVEYTAQAGCQLIATRREIVLST